MKKLTNFIRKVLKDSNKEYHHYPNISCEKPVIKTNTHFPLLPKKSTLSFNTTDTNNLTSAALNQRKSNDIYYKEM